MNNLNFEGERDKSKFQKKHEFVLCLTLSFESYLQKTHIFKCGFRYKFIKHCQNILKCNKDELHEYKTNNTTSCLYLYKCIHKLLISNSNVIIYLHRIF